MQRIAEEGGQGDQRRHQQRVSCERRGGVEEEALLRPAARSRPVQPAHLRTGWRWEGGRKGGQRWGQRAVR